MLFRSPTWNQYGFALRKTSTSVATVYAYRDGALIASSSATNVGNWATISSSSDLVLGSYRVSNSIITSGSNTWSGSFDDVFMATVITGAGETAFNNFYSSIYNSGNWADPNSVITGAFTSLYTPRVLFNWRFEESGSVLSTKDYGYYGNVHSASATGSVAGVGGPNLIATASGVSGVSLTAYNNLLYSGSAATNATIQFSTSSASVYENTSSYVIGISVPTPSSGQAATASISITSSSDTTASFGTDYKLIYNGTTYSASAQMPILVAWADGNSNTKYITASIFDNTTYTNTSSSINLKLSNSSGVTVGSPSLFALKILDYEEGYPSFTSASYGTGEASASVTIYVDRISGSSGPLTVDYSTANGTAISGTNYTSVAGTLSWSDTETTRKSFSVLPLFDHIQTSSKYFTVNLSNLSTGSYTSYPSAISSSTVTIQDQEQGTFRLASTTYSVTEGNSVTLTIERYSGSFGSVDVNLKIGRAHV